MSIHDGDVRITADEAADGSILRHHVEICSGSNWQRVRTTDTLSSAVYIAKQLQTPARTITVGYFLKSGQHDAPGKKTEDC